MKYTRNEFLKLTGLSISGAAVAAAGSGLTNLTNPGPRKDVTLRLGLASYTFRKFSLDDTIKWAKQLGLQGISLKDMHMPLTASASDIKATADKVRAAGLDLYGAGVIYM